VERASAASWYALAAYFARETAAGLRAHRLAAVLTVLIVAGGALLFEAFALVSYNLTRIAERGGASLFVELYLAGDVPEERQLALAQELGRLPEVREARWTSQAEALERFRAEGYGQLLEGIEGNPLPASILLELRPELEAAAGRELARSLLRRPEIEQWTDSAELAERLAAVVSIVRALVSVVGLTLALMLGFLVAGTVRLALDARRAEIDILELVGATPTFVRLPFVLQGAVLGAAGGALSVAALAGAWHALLGSFDLGDAMLVGIGSLRFFEPPELGLFVLVTTVLAAGASLLAVR
jgi:cell division transport system permease protein